VWYEDPINDAIRDGIKEAYNRRFATTGYTSKTGEGKPDIIYDDFIVEGVVYDNDVSGHYERFWKDDEYKKGVTNGNALLVVFCSPKQYTNRTPPYNVYQLVNKILRAEVPILIVTINFSSVWSFDTHYFQKGRATVTTTLRTNLTCYSFNATTQKFDNSGKLILTLQKAIDDIQPILSSTFVTICKLDGTHIVTTDVSTTIRDHKLKHTVDGLKEALLKKPISALRGKGLDDLTVYPPAKTRGTTEMGDLDDIASTPKKDEPYHVVVA